MEGRVRQEGGRNVCVCVEGGSRSEGEMGEKGEESRCSSFPAVSGLKS